MAAEFNRLGAVKWHAELNRLRTVKWYDELNRLRTVKWQVVKNKVSYPCVLLSRIFSRR
jgi:hypothetical protein